MRNLKDKVVLITGSSKGIGADMAKAFAAAGAKVVINYSSTEAAAQAVLTDIEAQCGQAVIVKADVSKEAEVGALFNQALQTYGRIDVLVNNAGVFDTCAIKDSTEAEFDRQFNINVKGTFFTLKEAATKLADGGSVINFSSSTTKVMFPGYGIYSASKAAVEQMSRVFSKEVGRGISVNTIAPGPTNTELFLTGKSEETLARLAASNAFNRIAEPEDITRIVLFLASDDAKWISGQTIAANGAMA